MALENKLGITDSAELAQIEEKLSKTKARALFENGFLNQFPVGTFEGLAKIYQYLFSDLYDFAGQVRTVNIAKGHFRFAPVVYLQATYPICEASSFGVSQFSQYPVFPRASCEDMRRTASKVSPLTA